MSFLSICWQGGGPPLVRQPPQPGNGTAGVRQAAMVGEEVIMLTRDRQMTSSDEVDTIW
ncbi:MAG: hypothetical protein N2A42_08400 [Luteolibacter sp.]